MSESAKTTEIEMPILDDGGRAQGSFILKLLPGVCDDSSPYPLLDLRKDPDRDFTLEPVQILEGQEYLYEVAPESKNMNEIGTDRPEIFRPDTKLGNRGRLRPGMYTGRLPVRILIANSLLGRLNLEVRSKKLGYLSHYRWMLRDLAKDFSEIVMERFAPTEQRFTIDEIQDARTLYQRFAFLRNLIRNESFEAAIALILARPHRQWAEEEELRPVGENIPASKSAARHLARPGPRVIWEQEERDISLRTLPALFPIKRKVESLDTAENRFVKFALSTWRSVISAIAEVLEHKKPSFPIERGLREVQEATDWIDSILSEDLFREVGNLTYFPANSQVLQKREGYRYLFRTYVEFEAAALLSWNGGEDVYGAGQRDVATLYEYWVFLQLAKIVSKFCQEPFDWGRVLEINEDGITVQLRRGKHKVLKGRIVRFGRWLDMELWFNRTFGQQSDRYVSWSRPMRPDASIFIRPHARRPSDPEGVWLHFDAKYRVENILSLFGDAGQSEEEEVEIAGQYEEEETKGNAKRADLLKMHAYHDAIRRSAGSYVVYPGDKQEELPEYHEILPGIGAFHLKPSSPGDAEGINTIEKFIEDVLDHVASQVTQHERWQFWTREIFKEKLTSYGKAKRQEIRAVDFLTRPPEDTQVLLGYVKNEKHMAWIKKNRLYNLRGIGRRGGVGLQSRELAAELVILYGPGTEFIELWLVSGDPVIATKERMAELQYPKPQGEVYLCYPLERIDAPTFTNRFSREELERIRKEIAPKAPQGGPVTTSLLEILKRLS
jgi:predicted component of viral defense system (DUF524 family)